MTERQAKRQLEKMLASFSPGSILHLLAAVIRQEGDDARTTGEEQLHQQCKQAEAALFVLGLGLDGVLPQ